MPKQQKRINACFVGRSIVVVAAFLSSKERLLCSAFSLVAPPMQQTATPSRSWKSHTYHPTELAVSDKVPSKVVLESPERLCPATGQQAATTKDSLMPALSSPLFPTKDKIEHHFRYTRTKSGRKLSNVDPITPAQVKSRIIRFMAATLIHEFAELKISKELDSWLSKLQADTFRMNQAIHDVISAQDNLQYAWNVAGEAIMEYGLVDTNGLQFVTWERTLD